MIFPALKLALLGAWLGLWLPMGWLALKAGRPLWRDRMMRWFSLGALRIVGVRLRVRGELSRARPLLLVTNHVSYLDILVICACCPVRFMPKSEISGWPVIGAVCRVTDAIFVERKPRSIGGVKEHLRRAFTKGEAVCIFPESTTGDGVRVLPFKSSFFHVLEEFGQGTPVVQPAAISYPRLCNLPVDRTQKPLIAWYGDMELLPHALRLLSLGVIDADIEFLPPLNVTDASMNRKQLAAACHDGITASLNQVRAAKPSALKS